MLDEKEVNIDNLRENVRSYQELEKTLEGVKNRIEKLSEIECHHKAVVDCIQSDRMYEYFMAQSDLDLTKEQIGVLQDEIRRESYRLEQLNAKCSSMKKELKNRMREDISGFRLPRYEQIPDVGLYLRFPDVGKAKKIPERITGKRRNTISGKEKTVRERKKSRTESKPTA